MREQSVDLVEMQKSLTALEDEDLLRIANNEYAEYRPEALKIVQSELRKRGYSEAQINEKHPQAAADDEAPFVLPPKYSAAAILAAVCFVGPFMGSALIFRRIFAPLVFGSMKAPWTGGIGMAFAITMLLISFSFGILGGVLWIVLLKGFCNPEEAKALVIFGGRVPLLTDFYLWTYRNVFKVE
jgi:hypothetical protein